MQGKLISKWDLLGGGEQAPPTYFGDIYYPRLTRTTPFLPTNPLPDIRPKDLACKEIAALLRYKADEPKLLEEILKVANKYGPLIPETFPWKYDTLKHWNETALEMDFLLRLIRHLKEHREEIEGVSVEDREADELRGRQELFKDAPTRFLEFTEVGLFSKQLPPIERPTQAFTEAVSGYLWGRFAKMGSWDATPGEMPGEMTITCGTLMWAHKELWDLLHSDTHIFLCARCGSPFPAKRSDATTCSPACGRALQPSRKNTAKVQP